MSIELKHDDGAWMGFAGASRFQDGTAPFFAEMTAPIRSGTHDQMADAMLVLDDGGDDPGCATLTINLMDEDGYAYAWIKMFPGLSWQEVKEWAEANLSERMGVRDLVLEGFKFDSF